MENSTISFVNSAQEFIPKCGIIAKKEWKTSDILELLEMRRKVKKNMNEYRQANMRIWNMCRAAKKEYLNRKCEEIKELENRNLPILHEEVKALVDKK